MSGTLSNIYSNVSFALQLHTEALARLQEQASTGARVNRASDDPSGAYQILGQNSQERLLGNYIDGLCEAVNTLGLSSTAIEDVMSQIVEVKTRLTQISSGIYGQEQRKLIAQGINDALEHIVLLANTKRAGQYLFGGSDTDSPPYVAERTDGKITAVTYNGSLEQRNVEAAPGVQSSSFYVGDNIFRSNERGDPVFLGDTGAKAGTGTSSVRGDVWLTVIHDGSNYKLSIDDGASYVIVPAGGDVNQAVTDSRTKRILYVDSTEITSTGVDLVRIPGTYDIFHTLVTIRDMLENDRGLSEAQLQGLLINSLNSLDEVGGLLVRAQVSVGSRIGFLDDLKDSLQKLQYDAQDEAARVQEADIAQVAIDLSRREVLYQMSLSVAAKIMSMSLLDFIA
ncbi:MAG TPA: flagellar hook-associated protein FlgL [Sedimentisphaerales bacterium]|nr:flagellar hook-associated protein FlgL [Sedimentisphaerales bacterium]